MPERDGNLARAQHAFRDAFPGVRAAPIRVVATDVDGTLTDHAGRLRAVGLDALHRLRAQAHAPTLVLVTGRPAALVQALLVYTGFGHCPIIAENGAVVLPHPGGAPHVVHPFRAQYTDAVEECLARAGVAVAPTDDTADRLADITYVPADPATRTPEDIRDLAGRVEAALAKAPASLGLPPTQVLYSSIHVHVGATEANKGRTLRRLLAGEVPGLPEAPVPTEALVCLGDSANDASLFEAFPDRAIAVPGPGPRLHPGLVGVARFAAPAEADAGFAAVIDTLFPPS